MKMENHHFYAMWEVRNGAEISDNFLIRNLQEIEHIHPEWLIIYKPESDEKCSCFTAILTALGKKALAKYMLSIT